MSKSLIAFTNTQGTVRFLGLSFMEEVRCALHDLAEHEHEGSGIPDNGEHIQTHADNVAGLKGQLGTIKG